MSSTATFFAPLAAATGDTVQLAMQRLWLTGQVLPAGARLVVQHVFRSAERQPVEVIYAFPLPRDAALRRFRISGEGFDAHSELRETEQAVKAYEAGISAGSLSALARQYGDGLVNLTVGNLRPGEIVTVYLEIVAGVELRDGSFRFRFPFTLAPGYHPRAKAVVTALGEGELELPHDEFGDVILPRFRKDATGLHEVGFDLAVTSSSEVDEIGSPSHGVRIKRESAMRSRVLLAAERDVPDRDLVLDAHFAAVAPQVLAGPGQDGRTRFAAIVPSASFGERPDTPRRLVFLLDRSGSMEGAPLQQATKAIEACLGALSEDDRFGLIAFDDRVELFEPRLAAGSRDNRDRAHTFLQPITARGGTELAQGFLEAARLLDGEGGDVLILTDGQVMGTEQILGQARSAGTRLHCLGIGSASQDRFLALLARETGGVSRFVTPRERVDLSAVDLFASIGRPVVSGLKGDAGMQPDPPAMVFSGTPVLVFGEAGETEPALTWEGGRLSLPLSSGDAETGETVRLLQGARLIADWESRYPSEEALGPLEKRKQSRVAARLIELSRSYGLASREMSLVAVVKRAGDRAGELPETRVVAVGMPQDTAFPSVFSRFATAPMAFNSLYRAQEILAPPPAAAALPAPMGRLRRTFARKERSEFEALMAPPPSAPEDRLLEIAVRMEADGGMPGADAESRAAATLLALFAFVSQGHTARSGVFRSHVARLLTYLRSLKGLPAARQRLLEAALRHEDRAPQGDWLALASSGAGDWNEIERSVSQRS